MKMLDQNRMKNSRGFFECKPSGANHIYILSMAALIVVGLVWAFFFKADEILRADAILRPIQNISVVTALTTGELLEKCYKNNQQIAAGDLLWKTDTKPQQIRLDNLYRDLAQTKQDIENFSLFLSSVTSGQNMINRKDKEAWLLAESYFSEKNRQARELEMLSEEIAREKENPEYLQVPQKIRDMEDEYTSLDMSFTRWKTDKETQLVEQLKNLRQQKRTYESSIADLEKTIRDAAVFAPISGKIDEIKKVNMGDMLFSGDQLIKIVPSSDDALKAEIMVQNSRVARIQEGQKVKLRFKGLPVAEFGQLQGTVTLVPADASGSGENGIPYFMVEARIDDPVLISRRGEEVLVRPGMMAETRIILSRKTIMQFVLNKLHFMY